MDDGVRQKVAAFFGQFPERALRKGQTIIRAEEPLTHVLYLVRGSVVEYDISPQGNEVIVNAFKPGAFFPMSSVLNDTPNHYFFEAAQPGAVRRAPKADVLAFMQQHPDVVFDLLRRVYRGTDGLIRRMAHLMGGNARTRLLFELLNAGYRFGVPRAGGAVLVPLSESGIAKRTGLSRETVNRTLRSFKDTGAITVTADGIRLQDMARLEALLGADL